LSILEAVVKLNLFFSRKLDCIETLYLKYCLRYLNESRLHDAYIHMLLYAYCQDNPVESDYGK